jgi:hypothetical protein
VALAFGGPAKPMVRELSGAVRKPFIGSSMVLHRGCCSQNLVEPTEKPSATWNHLLYWSLPWSHFRKSFASFWFLPYFMTPWANAVW